MSGKGALVFVGKSLAFALVSGLVWGMMLIFIASFSTRYRSGAPSSDERDRIAEQMDTYDRQTKETQKQLERVAQQQERAAQLLDTQERLYAEQEQLQKRFAAILDRWERIPAR